MNNVEIILRNIKKEHIEKVFFETLVFDVRSIISSYFYDSEKDVDMEYQNIRSLNQYFNIPGTGNIYLKKAVMGTELENVLILIACDEEYGDITVSFEEEQFENFSTEEIKSKLQNLIILLLKVYGNGNIEEITIGYEPADDDDMKVIEICQDKIKIFNENIFNSPMILTLYNIIKSS